MPGAIIFITILIGSITGIIGKEADDKRKKEQEAIMAKKVELDDEFEGD